MTTQMPIPFQWIVPRSLMSLANNMLGAYHQDHRRLRALVDQAFARRNINGMSERVNGMSERVNGMSERVNELAQHQLDVVSLVLAAEGQVDLIEHYARPLPLSVICELLGLPAEDRPKFTHCSSRLRRSIPSGEFFRLVAACGKSSSTCAISSRKSAGTRAKALCLSWSKRKARVIS